MMADLPCERCLARAVLRQIEDNIDINQRAQQKVLELINHNRQLQRLVSVYKRIQRFAIISVMFFFSLLIRLLFCAGNHQFLEAIRLEPEAYTRYQVAVVLSNSASPQFIDAIIEQWRQDPLAFTKFRCCLIQRLQDPMD